MPLPTVERRKPERLASIVIFLLLTTIIFLPRPPISGAHLLLYPVIGSIAGLAIFFFGFRTLPTKSKTFCSLLILTLLLYSILHFISLIINNVNIRQLAAIEAFRPVMLLLLFLAGLSLGKFGNQRFLQALGVSAKAILLGQLIICVTQGLNLHVFDSIYSSEKAFGLGSLFRVTGSMSNPNTLGWIVNHFTIVAFITTPQKKQRLIWLLLGTLLMLSTGSRSQFLLYIPAVIFSVWILKGSKITWKGMAIFCTSSALAFSLLLGVVYAFKDTFRYLWEVIKIFETGSLSSVKTFQMRLDMWDTKWSFFKRYAEDINWFLGLGPMPQFRVADNDYLYVTAKYGILGLSFQFILAAFLAYAFIKLADRRMRALGLTYLVFAMILGTQVETLGGWLYPLFPFFYCGLCLAAPIGTFTFEKRDLSSD